MPGFFSTDFNVLAPNEAQQLAFFDAELHPLIASVASGFRFEPGQADLVSDLLAAAAGQAPKTPEYYEVTDAIGYALSASLPLCPHKLPAK